MICILYNQRRSHNIIYQLIRINDKNRSLTTHYLFEKHKIVPNATQIKPAAAVYSRESTCQQ